MANNTVATLRTAIETDGNAFLGARPPCIADARASSQIPVPGTDVTELLKQARAAIDQARKGYIPPNINEIFGELQK